MTDRDRDTAGRYSCFIRDLDCPDCASKLEGQISRIDGVRRARISLVDSRLDVFFDGDGRAHRDEVIRLLDSLGYGVTEREGAAGGRPAREDEGPGRTRVILTGLAGLMVLAGAAGRLLDLPDPLPILAWLAAILLAGPPTFRKGILSLRSRSLDMNFLMTVAVAGAVGIGEWAEGAAVVFLFSLANLLESYTMRRARRAIRSLVDLSPRTASVLRDGREVKVPVAEVAVGERVRVRPGGRIPVDGRIVSGVSSVDQSPITGESVPVRGEPGDPVYAGTINGRGALEIAVEKEAEDTTLSRILHMVEEAQVQRAPAQRAIDRFSRVYTPSVVLGAVVLAAAPPLLAGLPFDVWFYRALVLLVVACPCALVISTPVTIISGLATAARRGILIKGGVFLERLGRLDAIALDKTGTITFGHPEVAGVHRYDPSIRERDLLQLAADCEARSEHPLAEAILRKAAAEGITPASPDTSLTLPGEGVTIEIEGRRFFAGNHRLFEERGTCPSHLHDELLALEEEGMTVVFLGTETAVIGAITLEDRIRPGIEATVTALRRAGVLRVVMLTGDNEATARGIARKVGITEFRAEQLPEDKAAVVRSLREECGQVAMVGDGINDAPALATASVGIAMGAAGTDVALETADVALMSDDLSNLPAMVSLGRKTLRVIRQNIGFAILTKAAFLALAPLGLVNLWMAVAADMGASLLVIFNGLRLLAPIRAPGSRER
jgi:Cd2+/Zn2+-exporting ATPase